MIVSVDCILYPFRISDAGPYHSTLLVLATMFLLDSKTAKFLSRKSLLNLSSAATHMKYFALALYRTL